MKILLDMNVSPRWGQFLEMSDTVSVAQHWATIGAPDTLDSDILSFAQANGYTIFTRDLDFGKLLAFSNSAKPSVIQLRVPDARIEICGAHVLQTLQMLQQELLQGALITIHERLAKIRMLPMQRD